jgi:predicted N-acetyltransferase YhbS
MLLLRPLAEIDPMAVEGLLDAAFGADRRNRTAYAMRRGVDMIPGLSFAALADTILVGTIQCWPVALLGEEGALTPLTLVGPVAVEPRFQSSGVGRALMDTMLNAAQNQETATMVMIGDPEYYGRFFGFSAAATQFWEVPGPVERHRLLTRCAEMGGLPVRLPVQGRIVPHPAFATEPATA